MTNAAKPRHAATVILLRRAVPTGFEVFLTQRAENMPFLGGMYCFPGGGVGKEDCSARMIERCSGLGRDQARKTIGAHLRPSEALGFWVAAIRELFEEVGILLAVNSSGARIAMNAAQRKRLAEKHAALIGKTLNFSSLLESEDLRCDLAALAYFSHWQTPAQNAIRFDTRFFLAGLPKDQMPLASSYEVAHSLWLTPDKAIQLFEHGELPLIFPTFASLRTLANFNTLESLFGEFGGPGGVASSIQA